MNENIYMLRGEAFVFADRNYTSYTGYHIVVADSKEKACKKALKPLRRKLRECKIDAAEVKELRHSKDVSLETRLDILEEIFPVIR